MIRADRTMSEPSTTTRKWIVLFLPAALLLVALGVLVFIVMPARHRQGSGMRTGDFIDTIGVNTHIGSNPYNNPAQLSSLLAYLGVANVRQSSPIDAASMANIAALGKLGAKIDLIVNGGGPVNLAGAMANVNQLAPYLNAVEGPNEVAIYPIQYGGLSGVDAAVALQKDLYAAVRANPALAQASVYLFTLGGADPSAFPSIGDLSAYTDDANIHSYPPHGLRPIFVIHAAISGGQTDAPSKPVVLTETGFYTLTNGVGWGGVPQSLQASYLLDEVLDEAVAGVQRTYLYDLIDDGVDPNGANQEFHFGLFNNDGTPKLAATAFHNLTTILADSGANSRTFTPDSFAFTATGVPYNYTGNTTSFEKSDGTHVIAVWNEEQLWNTDTQTAIAAQTYPVTVDLQKIYPTVLVIDPLLGTGPIQTLQNVSTVSLSISDHPLLIVIPPAGSGGGTATNPAPTSGLVLNVSEDAWMGDAQFVVHLDGQQVGGVYTATASHAAGQSQALVLAGTVPDGTHQVSVTFVNDAYGGSTNADRNLYVDGASYNGQAIAGSMASLLANGTDAFAATVGTPVSAPAPTGNGLVVTVAEDAWQGDAQFTVTVDGAQVGGLYTATASHAAGQTQAITIANPFAAGVHHVGIAFVNDAYGGSASMDRNLYVTGASDNGTPIAGAAATLFANGTDYFSAGAALTSTAVLHVSEDAWLGDAQFTVAVDGQRQGGVYTATASHAGGQSQAITVAGLPETFSAHDLAVTFLNDAYGGSPSTDRNLYVDAVQFDGQPVAGASAILFGNGTTHFAMSAPPNWAGS